MAITLNHTIVPAHNKEASAKFFAHMFGLKYENAMGHFAPVRVNETLTLDFDNWDHFEMHHYAFHVSDAEFTGEHADQHPGWRARRLFQGSQRPPTRAYDPDLIGLPVRKVFGAVRLQNAGAGKAATPSKRAKARGGK